MFCLKKKFWNSQFKGGNIKDFIVAQLNITDLFIVSFEALGYWTKVPCNARITMLPLLRQWTEYRLLGLGCRARLVVEGCKGTLNPYTAL